MIYTLGILLSLLIGFHSDGLEMHRLQIDCGPVGVDFGPYRRVGDVHVADTHLDGRDPAAGRRSRLLTRRGPLTPRGFELFKKRVWTDG